MCPSVSHSAARQQVFFCQQHTPNHDASCCLFYNTPSVVSNKLVTFNRHFIILVDTDDDKLPAQCPACLIFTSWCHIIIVHTVHTYFAFHRSNWLILFNPITRPFQISCTCGVLDLINLLPQQYPRMVTQLGTQLNFHQGHCTDLSRVWHLSRPHRLFASSLLCERTSSFHPFEISHRWVS